MQIRNICRINYQHVAPDDEPLIHEVVYSNQVQTTMIDKRIIATKFVDKDHALFFEQLTYTIEMQNISNHDIPYCYFEDVLACNLIFKSGSVMVDGVSLYHANPQAGFYIFDLLAHSKKMITFKVIVNYCSKKSAILNTAKVEYPHQYHVMKTPINWVEESNTTYTNVLSKQVTYFGINQFIFGPAANCFRLVEMETCIESQRIKIYPNNKRSKSSEITVIVKAKINYKLMFKPYQNQSRNVGQTLVTKHSFWVTKYLYLSANQLADFDVKVLKLYFCEACSYQSGLRGIYLKFVFLLAVNSI